MTKRHLKRALMMLLVVAMMTTTACAVDTTYPGTMNVVEADKVIGDFNADPNIIVIDARGREAYDKGHMSGAICMSVEDVVVETTVPGMLMPKEAFEKLMAERGISNNSIVYIYDDQEGIFAARLWWTMKVYGHENVKIVNGGASALVNAGATLTAEETILPAASYIATEPDQSMIATMEEVTAVVNDPTSEVKLLDVRSAAEYAEGYIPGAILYPHTQNLYKDGTFMSSRDLGLFYKDAGFEKDDTIIVYCKTSVRATQAVALLQEAGFTNLKVYDGAWLEWSSINGASAPTEETAPVGESDGS